ncbi:hypothetical protein KW792_01490 [Candidatus Saccharibacteria bacterium]|nr:hypothetical protein [Candidatus Saccharibacteria bacterium]
MTYVAASYIVSASSTDRFGLVSHVAYRKSVHNPPTLRKGAAMKRKFVLGTVLMLSLIAAGAASAKGPPPPSPVSTTPATFNGTAGSSGTTVTFVNPTEGAPLRFDTSWLYKAGGHWSIWVKHLRDPKNIFSYDTFCEVEGADTKIEWGWTGALDLIGYSAGVSTCEYSYAEAGTWTVTFKSLVGKTDFSVLITTPVLNPSPVPNSTSGVYFSPKKSDY